MVPGLFSSRLALLVLTTMLYPFAHPQARGDPRQLAPRVFVAESSAEAELSLVRRRACVYAEQLSREEKGKRLSRRQSVSQISQLDDGSAGSDDD